MMDSSSCLPLILSLEISFQKFLNMLRYSIKRHSRIQGGGLKTFFTEGRADISRGGGSVSVFLRKHIVTCDYSLPPPLLDPHMHDDVTLTYYFPILSVSQWLTNTFASLSVSYYLGKGSYTYLYPSDLQTALSSPSVSYLMV